MNKKKVFIEVALTGEGASVKKNPNLPRTPEEIAKCAYDVWKAGAAMVHIHLRNPETDWETGSMDPKIGQETIDRIRAYKDCDIIVNCTSTGDSRTATDKQKSDYYRNTNGVEVGSYDTVTFNWGGSSFLFENNPDFLRDLGSAYVEKDIRGEIEVFDMGTLSTGIQLMEEGYVKKPGYFSLIMGVNGGSEPTVENMLYLKQHLPDDAVWAATGIGHSHLRMMYATLALGGNIRLGLEDNLYYAKGVKASNVTLVERAVRLIRECGMEVATPAEAREILGIKPLVNN